MPEGKSQAIIGDLKNAIFSGRYGRSGSNFPTIRELCVQYAIALKTAFKIQTQLHEEGIIEKSGRNYVIADMLHQNASKERPMLLGFLATWLGSPYFAQLATYAEELANSIGASLVIATSGYDFAKEQERLKMFCQQGVSGIMICPWSTTPEQEAFYKTLPVPYTLLGRRLESFECDAVLVDNEKGAYEMAKHLIATGAKEFAYIGQEGKLHDRRLSGFQRGLSELDLEIPKSNILRLDYSDQPKCRAAMRKLLSRHRSGRLAVFCYHDLFAIRLNNICHELSLRVPEDIAIAGFDNLPLTEETWPPLTSVSYPIKEMVQLAFESLYSSIKFPGLRKGFARYLDPKVIVRASTTVGK